MFEVEMDAGKRGMGVFAQLRVVIDAYDRELGRNRDVKPPRDVQHIHGGVVVFRQHAARFRQRTEKFRTRVGPGFLRAEGFFSAEHLASHAVKPQNAAELRLAVAAPEVVAVGCDERERSYAGLEQFHRGLFARAVGRGVYEGRPGWKRSWIAAEEDDRHVCKIVRMKIVRPRSRAFGDTSFRFPQVDELLNVRLCAGRLDDLDAPAARPSEAERTVLLFQPRLSARRVEKQNRIHVGIIP